SDVLRRRPLERGSNLRPTLSRNDALRRSLARGSGSTLPRVDRRGRAALTELGPHRGRPVALVHLREAVPLIQVYRGAVRRDAEADRPVPLRAGAREQRVHQLAAKAVAALAGDDRDRELRRLLVDEPVARRRLFEQAVPRRADREALVERDHGRIAGTAPVLHVAHRMQPALVLVFAGAPVVRVPQHVAEEAGVLRRAPADHGREAIECRTVWKLAA